MNELFSWIVGRSYMWGRSFLELDKNDMILASFPKTGSTWVRYYLYMLLIEETHSKLCTIDKMNYAMPEFAHSSFFSKWSFGEIPRIIKTHQRCLPIFKNKKAVLIVRDPRDIVVSYYHYLMGKKSCGFHGSISDIIKHPRMGVESFFKHYRSWHDSVGLILRYEDLKDDPLTGFSALADYYGIKRNKESIRNAITRSSFTSMRMAQDKSETLKSTFKSGHQFVRSGDNAQWKELFRDEEVFYYEQMKDRYNFDIYDK